MNTIFISIGSNIQRTHNIASCLQTLRKTFEDFTVSPIYESPAEGFDGSDFYNAVASFSTERKLEAVCTVLRQIEEDHGRIRSIDKFVSRTLDLDLLLFNDEVIDTEQIQIPSPEIVQYLYVLFPLADIAPHLTHPTLGKSYAELQQAFEKKSNYKKFDAAELLVTSPVL